MPVCSFSCPQSNPPHNALGFMWCSSIFSCCLTESGKQRGDIPTKPVWKCFFLSIPPTLLLNSKSSKLAAKYKSNSGWITSSRAVILLFSARSWVARAYGGAIYIWAVSAEWISPLIYQGKKRKEKHYSYKPANGRDVQCIKCSGGCILHWSNECLVMQDHY